MNVEYIQHMGNDMTVVNAARVSFANHSYNSTPSSADISLLKYLARGSSNDEWSALVNKLASTSDRTAIQKLLWAFKTHQTHFAPFTHPQLSVRITAPLAVARQLWKSHVGVAGGGTARLFGRHVPPSLDSGAFPPLRGVRPQHADHRATDLGALCAA